MLEKNGTLTLSAGPKIHVRTSKEMNVDSLTATVYSLSKLRQDEASVTKINPQNVSRILVYR